MSALVGFRAGGSDWVVPVAQAREVRTARGLVPLPAPVPGVAGVLRDGEQALTVLTVFPGEAPSLAGHVLVLEAGGRSFGVLVEEVTGVRQVPDAEVGPPPHGQRAPLVSGVVRSADGVTFVLDAAALGVLLDRVEGEEGGAEG